MMFRYSKGALLAQLKSLMGLSASEVMCVGDGANDVSLFCAAANLGFFAYLGVAACAVILYFEHRIVRSDFSKIDRAFFTLNGYLGILFFVFC